MAAPAQPFGQQCRAVGRGFGPALRDCGLALVLAGGLTALIVLTRQWDSLTTLQAGKVTLMASGVGLGAGFLTGGLPCIGGGERSWSSSYSEKMNTMDPGLKVVASICVMVSMGALLNYYPAVGMGLCWFLIGNHLWHKSRQMGEQAAPAAAADAPQAGGMPGRGYRLS
jgi:hypothetical protein